jgi:hypothetical protein
LAIIGRCQRRSRREGWMLPSVSRWWTGLFLHVWLMTPAYQHAENVMGSPLSLQHLQTTKPARKCKASAPFPRDPKITDLWGARRSNGNLNSWKLSHPAPTTRLRIQYAIHRYVAVRDPEHAAHEHLVTYLAGCRATQPRWTTNPARDAINQCDSQWGSSALVT